MGLPAFRASRVATTRLTPHMKGNEACIFGISDRRRPRFSHRHALRRMDDGGGMPNAGPHPKLSIIGHADALASWQTSMQGLRH